MKTWDYSKMCREEINAFPCQIGERCSSYEPQVKYADLTEIFRIRLIERLPIESTWLEI